MITSHTIQLLGDMQCFLISSVSTSDMHIAMATWALLQPCHELIQVRPQPSQHHSSPTHAH